MDVEEAASGMPAFTRPPSSLQLRSSKIRQHVRRGDIEGVRQELAAGVDINVSATPGVDNMYRMSILHEAVHRGHRDMVAFLLQNGADPNGRSRWTPLMYAAVNDDAAIAELLLDAGADPSTTDWGGHTPASLARINHFAIQARRLIQQGRSPALYAADASDRTVLEKCDEWEVEKGAVRRVLDAFAALPGDTPQEKLRNKKALGLSS